jgi:cytochrome c oxidase subunit IV
MSDQSHAHGPVNIKPYIAVFVALSIFTAVSFIVNRFVHDDHISATTGFILILSVAVIKALLVVAIFMHLKWDWGRLYFMIIPAMILAPMLVFALLPDIVLYWKHVQGWNLPK